MARVRNTNTPFPMDHGIEKILRRDSGDHVDTGPASDISPAYSPVKPRLEQLYALPNLEDYLARELAPSPMQEPQLLLPNRFNHALRAAAEFLIASSEEDARNARILRRAARLLKEQDDLRALVQMYRQALLKG